MPPTQVAISIIYINSTPRISEVWSGNCFKTNGPTQNSWPGWNASFLLSMLLASCGPRCHSIRSLMAKHKYHSSPCEPHFHFSYTKNKNPKHVHEYLPISLCNVLYVNTLFCPFYDSSSRSLMKTSLGGPRLI